MDVSPLPKQSTTPRDARGAKRKTEHTHMHLNICIPVGVFVSSCSCASMTYVRVNHAPFRYPSAPTTTSALSTSPLASVTDGRVSCAVTLFTCCSAP